MYPCAFCGSVHPKTIGCSYMEKAMPKITSNGGRDHLQCNLSGDLPKDQGTPGARELRLVRLTGDGGNIGSYDFHSFQQVMFDAEGRPIHIQDLTLVSGVDDYHEGSDQRATEGMRRLLQECLAALDKPVINLSE